MRVGLVIYGSLDTMSGGYLYDRKMVAYLGSQGDPVEVVSIPPASYFAHLLGGLSFRLPSELDIVIEDELVHPSVLFANGGNSAVPAVSLIHNLHSSERRAAWQNAIFRQIERWHLASVNGYIFNSTVTQESVARLVPRVKPSVLAPPGGDRLGSLTMATVQDRVTAPHTLRLLFLANVTPLKGLHVLLDALELLPAGICTLDVAGSLAVEPRYAAQMQQKAAALSTPVFFHGIVDGQSLYNLLADSDVLVVPSFWEGFGISFLEGMAFGLPALGTTVGAMPQMIRDGVNGYLIEPGDRSRLAEIIRSLASDRSELAAVSERALSYYASCPTWDESMAMIRRFLLDMTERARTADLQRDQ